MNAKVQFNGSRAKALLLFFFCANVLVAQKWELRINTGYSQASQSYDKFFYVNPWKKNIHNLYFGMDIRYKFNDHWQLSLSALLIEKGYKNAYTLIFDDIDSTNQLVRHIEVEHKFYYSLNYIDFPLKVDYALKKWKVGAGIYFSYAVAFTSYTYMRSSYYNYNSSVNYQYTTTNLLRLGNSRGKPGDPFNLLGTSFDFGFSLSTSYAINKNFDLMFMLSRGLKDSFNYKEGTYSYGLGYNVVFLLGLNYKLLKF